VKPDKLILELEEIVSRLGFKVRKEKGNFRGSNCILAGERIIMLNRNTPVEMQIGTLAKFILSQKHDELFLKPVVRKELEAIWEKLEITSDPEFNFDGN
jgi:hypothetical protein